MHILARLRPVSPSTPAAALTFALRDVSGLVQPGAAILPAWFGREPAPRRRTKAILPLTLAIRPGELLRATPFIHSTQMGAARRRGRGQREQPRSDAAAVVSIPMAHSRHHIAGTACNTIDFGD